VESYRLAVFCRDGIGPEVAGQALRVLEAAATQRAVEAALSQGVGTPDPGGQLRNGQMTDLIIQQLLR
jgi:isocitrate/isopropylmalate dehydrogenase